MNTLSQGEEKTSCSVEKNVCYIFLAIGNMSEILDFICTSQFQNNIAVHIVKTETSKKLLKKTAQVLILFFFLCIFFFFKKMEFYCIFLVFHCQKSILRKSSFRHLRQYFFVILLSTKTLILWAKRAVIDFWRAKVPKGPP